MILQQRNSIYPFIKNNKLQKHLHYLLSDKETMQTKTPLLNFSSLSENDQLDTESLDRDLILTSKKQMFLPTLLLKMLCAAMNSPKGTNILIGVQKLSFKVIGENLNDADLEYLQSSLKKAQTSLQPEVREGDIQMKVFQVVRQKNISNGGQTRFIICLDVNPINKKQTYYYKTKIDKYYSKENFCVIEKNQLVFKEREEIYHLILNKYKNPIKKTSSIVRTNYEVSQVPQGILEKQNQIQMPLFKYEYNTIITFPAKRKPLLDQLFTRMKNDNIKFIALKPFQSLFRNEYKEIWFVSSDRLYDKQLKKIKSSFFLNYFSIKRTLKIINYNKRRITECKKQWKRVWKLPENEIFQQISEEHCNYLVFKKVQFALFAFVFFDYHSVRVSFCKNYS